MPTVEDHKEIALSELRRLAQPDSTPSLDDVELNSILDAVQRASFWITATAFVFDDVVMPTVRNGHRYVCVTPGQTGATEPVWPIGTGSKITDGTAEWQEAGPDYDNVFDVRAAAHQAWTVKEGKASELFDIAGQSVSQIAEHCRDMAERFHAVDIA
jgi:hypothetical protein